MKRLIDPTTLSSPFSSRRAPMHQVPSGQDFVFRTLLEALSPITRIATLGIAIAVCIGSTSQGDEPITRQLLLEKEAAALKTLQRRCLACHNETKSEGGFDISTGTKAFQHGDSGEFPFTDSDLNKSEAWKRINSSDLSLRMPPEGEALNEIEKRTLKEWIENGPLWRESQDQSLEQRLLSAEESIRHDVRFDTQLPLLEHYGKQVPTLAAIYLPWRHQLIVAGWGELLVWNTESKQLENRLAGLERRVNALALTGDKNWILASTGEPGIRGYVHAIPVATMDRAIRLWSDNDMASAIAGAPDKPIALIGSMSGRISLIHCETKTVLHDEIAHADQVLCVAWNASGSKWISGSRDRTARVSEFPSMQLSVAYSGHDRAVGGVTFSEYGPLTADESGSLRLWASDNGGRVLTRRADYPPRIGPICIDANTIRWLDGAQLLQATIRKTVETEEDKDEQGKPKKKTVYTMQREVDRPIESIDARLYPSGVAGCFLLLDSDRTVHILMHNRESPSITLDSIYP